MFNYRPPKGSCWGHALIKKGSKTVEERLDAFFAKYFEPTDPPPRKSLDGSALDWKASALPDIHWPEDSANSPNPVFRQVLVMLSFGRITFPMGITIPISITEDASYEFIRQFNADAPFKMSAKHFSLIVPAVKKGKSKLAKVDAETLSRLSEVIP